MYNMQKKFVHYLVAVPIPCCPFGWGPRCLGKFLGAYCPGKNDLQAEFLGEKKLPQA